MHEYQTKFVDFLVQCGAFRLGTFSLKSGRVSPTFVNTGLVEDGTGLLRLGEAYAGRLLAAVGAGGFDSVFGPAYKGIPLAVATAVSLAAQGERIALVDDVLTTGATKYESVALLKSLVEGARFPALVIAVDRQETGPEGIDAASKFTQDTGIPVFPAVTMTEALTHLEATERLPAGDRKRCVEYLAQYGTPAAKSWAAARA